MPLAVGTKAPDFTLKTKTAEGLVDVRLSDSFGKRPTVLLFFPAAFTGGCTKELTACSRGIGEPLDESAAVYGISADSAFAQAAWAAKEGITVTLLSDYKREVIQAYDVVHPDLSGLGPSAARAVFVIDKEGVIRHAEQTEAPSVMPDFDAIRAVLSGL
jgi:peroxiredoxin